VDDIDAFDGTPVIDIKPYVPRLDAVSKVRMPGWADK
jgi:tRNA (Thr-GGU) A37 N-methylase